MNSNSFNALFKVLSSEQQILMRTDQKAFTLLSILGVFMVFFIIHFLKIQINWFTFILVFVYFLAAFMAIVYLVLVIVPRVREDKINEDNPETLTSLGDALWHKGKTEEGLEKLNKAVEIDPDHPKANYNLAVFLSDNNELNKALNHFQRCQIHDWQERSLYCLYKTEQYEKFKSDRKVEPLKDISNE